MICVYDTVMTGMPATFRRYGVTYHLEKRFRMGDKVFYSFVADGQEKVLVVPGFAQQYREAEAKCQKFGKGKSFEEYVRLVKRNINNFVVLDKVPSDEDETGLINTITADYKDIRVTFECTNSGIKIAEEFEIRDNNIFGNGIVVLMNMNMEES